MAPATSSNTGIPNRKREVRPSFQELATELGETRARESTYGSSRLQPRLPGSPSSPRDRSLRGKSQYANFKRRLAPRALPPSTSDPDNPDAVADGDQDSSIVDATTSIARLESTALSARPTKTSLLPLATDFIPQTFSQASGIATSTIVLNPPSTSIASISPSNSFVPTAPQPSQAFSACVVNPLNTTAWTCSSDSLYCDPSSMTCRPKLTEGLRCSSDQQCASGVCRAGVCNDFSRVGFIASSEKGGGRGASFEEVGKYVGIAFACLAGIAVLAFGILWSIRARKKDPKYRGSVFFPSAPWRPDAGWQNSHSEKASGGEDAHAYLPDEEQYLDVPAVQELLSVPPQTLPPPPTPPPSSPPPPLPPASSGPPESAPPHEPLRVAPSLEVEEPLPSRSVSPVTISQKAFLEPWQLQVLLETTGGAAPEEFGKEDRVAAKTTIQKSIAAMYQDDLEAMQRYRENPSVELSKHRRRSFSLNYGATGARRASKHLLSPRKPSTADRDSGSSLWRNSRCNSLDLGCGELVTSSAWAAGEASSGRSSMCSVILIDPASWPAVPPIPSEHDRGANVESAQAQGAEENAKKNKVELPKLVENRSSISTYNTANESPSPTTMRSDLAAPEASRSQTPNSVSSVQTVQMRPESTIEQGADAVNESRGNRPPTLPLPDLPPADINYRVSMFRASMYHDPDSSSAHAPELPK
ncbi:uncharacterized protein VTP21DRAFT_969 [Calcarisporiella thermophila]|uniref:uncharacterized protein n=1 Tax=Calcarisporiella thermophila TaxID=911321 RepID=UPI003743A21D